MIRIDYIQEFVKLADYLSFSRASEDLYITQPSLSRHVSLLESELGVKLLDRNTRSVSMTKAGTELYRDFTKLLEDYRTIIDRAGLLSSGYSGQLRISTPAYWLAEYVEPAILQFSQHFPEVKVDLDICDPIRALEQLRSGKSDLAVGFELESLRSEFVCKKFFEERLCVVMSRTHPLAGRRSVSLRDFAADQLVVPEMDESRARLRSFVETLLSTHGIDLSNCVRSRDTDTVGLSIRQTGGVCVLPSSLGNLGRDSLVSVPLSDEDCILSLYLFRKRNCESKSVLDFFEMAPFIRI